MTTLCWLWYYNCLGISTQFGTVEIKSRINGPASLGRKSRHGVVMRNLLVTIVGHDRPGIVHLVSKVLAGYRCHVVEVSQTTLLGEFAGLFSCRMAREADLNEFNLALGQALQESGMAHWVTEGGSESAPEQGDIEPYVVTVRGPDQLGMIPEFSGVMSNFEANIDNLRAVSLQGPQDAEGHVRPATAEGGESSQVVMFFEISVPKSVNQAAFRQALNLVAESLSMELSLQHRDIFEAIHRL